MSSTLQRLGSPKLAQWSQQGVLSSPKRARALKKSASGIKTHKKVTANNGYTLKPELNLFATSTTAREHQASPMAKTQPLNMTYRSNGSAMRPPKSTRNFVPMTAEHVEIESLKAKIVGLEAALAGEIDAENQIAQLKRQLQVANQSNDKLVASMGQMERQHAQAMQTLMKEHSVTVKHLRDETAVLGDQINETHVDRVKIQKELKSASKYIGQLEERTFEANKMSLDLLTKVRDLEVENVTLKNYIIDLKARVAVYVPVKGDPVDNKMAEFVNNYPDRNKLKMMFMRDSEGIYEFGSKRVNVRVEKNKIQIRVGGGYLSIDEFLDQFTPVELEKLERRDPLKRFSEKVMLQKTINGHSMLH